MPNLPPPTLTTTAHRARAAAIIGAALRASPMAAFTLAETVDAVSVAVLRTAGLDDETTRAVLAALWERPSRRCAFRDTTPGIRR